MQPTNCPSCNKPVPFENININTGFGKCDNCHSFFRLEQVLPPSASPSAPLQRLEVFLPFGLEILKLTNELNLYFSWRKSISVFLVLFALIWNGVLAIFVAAALFTGEYIIFAFISIHLLVAIIIDYYLIASMVNTSTISIRSNEITVVHEPLPWINRNKTFDARDITQLYSETYEMGKQNNNPVYAFRVMMQLKDGKTTKLLSGLKNAEQALFKPSAISHQPSANSHQPHQL